MSGQREKKVGKEHKTSESDSETKTEMTGGTPNGSTTTQSNRGEHKHTLSSRTERTTNLTGYSIPYVLQIF